MKEVFIIIYISSSKASSKQIKKNKNWRDILGATKTK